MALRIQQWRPDIETTEVVRDKRTGSIEIKGAVIARAGVLTYRDAGGSWSELRDPAVMHSAAALASYDGQYVLLGSHPKKQCGAATIVTTANAASLERIGTIRNPRPSTAVCPDTGKTLVVTRGDIRINTRAGVQAFNAGIRGFSAGYVADVLTEKGEHNGVRYDRRQLTDVGNHLVLTGKPRAGSVTEVRMDTDDAVCGSLTDTTTTTTKRRPMPQIIIDGMGYEVDPALAAVLRPKLKALTASEARGDTLDAEVTTLKAQTESQAGEIKALKVQVEARGDTEDQIEKQIEERLAFRAEVTPYLPAKYVFKGKTTTQVKGDAIAEGLGLTDLEDGEIPGAYKALLKSKPATATTANPSTNGRTSGGTQHTRRLAAAATAIKGDTTGGGGSDKPLTRREASLQGAARGFGPRT
ncbi:MAG: DUF2213 domain-containing protein [bacterium]|nr:DUF2213 domain-containing protein [bacterium]